MPHHPFTSRVIHLIRSIPRGYVATYGQIAALAGNRRSARQVARILHTCAQKNALPWHRVINHKGQISLPTGQGHEEQRQALMQEGVYFNVHNAIDLEIFLWQPAPRDISQILKNLCPGP